MSNLTQTYEWEKEFPRLAKIKTPKILLADSLIGLERGLRKLIFWGVVLLMAYVLYYRFNQYFSTGDTSNIIMFPPKEDLALWTWKGYRNLFYGLLFIDLLLLIPTAIIHAVRNNYPKLVKLILSWFLLLLFITFSYAIAGIISDLLVIGISLHWITLKNVGAPVGPRPFGITPI
jgi:hypothetical protein